MADFKVLLDAEINTNKVEEQIKNLQGTGITFNNATLSTQALESIQRALNNYQFRLNIDGIKVSSINSQMNSAGASAGKAFSSSFGKQVESITHSFSNIANLRNKMSSDFGLSSSTINNVTKDLEELKIAIDVIQTTSNSKRGTFDISVTGTDKMGQAITLIRQYSAENGELLNVSERVKTSMDGMVDSLKMSKLDNKMSAWLEKNTKASKDFGGSIDSLRNRLKSLYDQGKLTESEFQKIDHEFQLIQQSAIAAGKVGKSFGTTLKNAFQGIFGVVTTATVLRETVQILKQMYQEVLSIDTAMTELKKVTDETEASYSRFLDNAASSAKEVGASISEFINSTADFARLGYNLKQSQELAKVANIYNVVGDDIGNIDEATNSIISTLVAFNIEAGNAISIVDKFNAVGNSFAISSGGIGTALAKSASSLAAANNTIDESIALITAANTVVQNPESVGTAFKTLSMRIRGSATELEEAGLDADGMASSVSELRSEIMALSGVDIMIDDSTFKSTYQILKELSEVWENLTDVSQANITELLAGKRQGNIMASLMRNFDIAEDVLKTSTGSEGSALKEHAKWMESLEAENFASVFRNKYQRIYLIAGNT